MNVTPTRRTVDVTPAMAEKWLTENTHNRHLNDRTVAALAGAMLRGEWVENGDAIRFAVPRVLLDGQHRLHAVVRSGITIRTDVVEGLPVDAQMTMDVGRKRSFADILKLRGETDWNSVAALTTRIYKWETGQIRSINRPASHAQLLAIWEKNHAEIRSSISVAHAVRRQLPMTISILALGAFLFQQLDDEDCAAFFDGIKDGAGLEEGSPILAFRRLVLNEMATNNRRHGRMNEVLLLALLIKAWNAYRAGETVQLLKWRSGGAKPESFPVPQ